MIGRTRLGGGDVTPHTPPVLVEPRGAVGGGLGASSSLDGLQNGQRGRGRLTRVFNGERLGQPGPPPPPATTVPDRPEDAVANAAQVLLRRLKWYSVRVKSRRNNSRPM